MKKNQFLPRLMTIVNEEPAAGTVNPAENEQNKVSNVGTISYLPATFGLFCASVVINEFLGK